jgi:hypothetical protein
MEDGVSPLAVAALTAGAALLGSIIGILGQLAVEWFKARRQSESDHARAARELRLAGRLVMEELAEAMSLIQGAGKAWRYWVAPRRLPTDTWNQYRTDVAAAIESPLDWRFITSAYDAINNLNWVVDHRRFTAQDAEAPIHGVRVGAVDETREVWRSIRRAIATLEAVTGVQGPASRLMREQEDAESEYWPFGDGADFDEEEARLDDMIRRQQEGEY